ncbi:MAG: Na+/H+ antiporter subunit E [Rickettsiaceae bacterium]|nr:Na+/H+ antiporter subunit E [Rickettsiaceae bacterium]
MLTKLCLFLSLILIWLGLTGWHDDLLQQIFLLLIPTITFLFCLSFKILPQKSVFKINSITYLFWLIKEIIMASYSVIQIAWRRDLLIQPSMEIIKSKQHDEVGVVVFANSITLTPGTITLSVEKNHLLVHSLDISFMDDLKTGTMDNKVKKIIR